ncbi:MAG: hypothetical protein IJQ81_11135 [Oscillibacter sp.]|nr:hypothetical protein [Oscillibacter sp.]
MAYDPNRDYAKEIDAAIASGAPKETVAQLNAERNEKIAANQAHYDARGIGANDQYGTAAQNYVSGNQSGVGASQTPQAAQPSAQPQQPAQRTLPQSADSAALSQQAARTVENNRRSYVDTGTFRGYLDDWLNSAREQSESRIDRGVTQGVNELARVQEDAKERYQTQRNQIDADERRALDNRALYDAMRGDRGGIGAEQYSSIQNAAMQARVTVNSAQTKLANDTARQIAELRADGEFQKSQEILQLNQEYISRLSALEQWAMDYNASVDQFNAALDQWLASYNFQLRQLDLSQYQWEQSFAYQKEVDERNYNRSVFESDRAFGYQQGRDAVLDARDERNFNFQQRQYDDSREDAAWQKGFQEKQYADSRADTRWQQGMAERQYADSRADTAWQQGMTERQYADSRSDTKWQQGVTEQQLASSDLSNLRQYVMTALSSGYMVDDATLAKAKIDKNYASLIVSNARNAAALEAQKANVELENKQADTANKQASALKSAASLSEKGSAKKPTLTAEQVQTEIRKKNLSPNVLTAYEYYYGESYFRKNPSAYPVDNIKSRQDAISALKLMGLEAAASGLMNSSQWNSRRLAWVKDKTIDDPVVSGYSNFLDYVRDYVRAMRGDEAA